jgi:hypothetical protein
MGEYFNRRLARLETERSRATSEGDRNASDARVRAFLHEMNPSMSQYVAAQRLLFTGAQPRG